MFENWLLWRTNRVRSRRENLNYVDFIFNFIAFLTYLDLERTEVIDQRIHLRDLFEIHWKL